MIRPSIIIIPAMLCIAWSSLSAQDQPITRQPVTTSIVGTPTRLAMAVENVFTSMAWYARLGFSPLSSYSTKPDSVMYLTDGQVAISLVRTSMPSPVLYFRAQNMKAVMDTLKALAIAMTYDVRGPSFGEIRFRSPGGVFCAVRPADDEPAVNAAVHENTVCGRNTEWSIGVDRLAHEKNFWHALGFTVRREANVPYPFAIMSDGIISIGLHEQRDIPTLAITYFATDMEARIDRLKKSGITFEEEIPSPDNRISNAILKSTDGQLIFMFEGVQ